ALLRLLSEEPFSASHARRTGLLQDAKRGRLDATVCGPRTAHAGDEAVHKAALRVVERWNAERSSLWSPTIRYAIVAGTPWLDVYWPGCRTLCVIDIRTAPWTATRLRRVASRSAAL